MYVTPLKPNPRSHQTVYFFSYLFFCCLCVCLAVYFFLYTSVGCGLLFTFCTVQFKCNSVAMWTLV
eukprot:UN01777